MNATRKIIRVSDVMHDRFLEIDGMSTVEDAILEMKKAKAMYMIVNKRNDDDEYGIVLLADIAKKVLAKDRAPARVNVYEIMTKPVITVHPEMDVRYCARLFERFGISLTPVQQDGKIVGTVDYYTLVMDGLLDMQQ